MRDERELHMSRPIVDHVHKEQLRHNRLGLWLFFVSEAFLFGGLLAVRFYLWGEHRPELDQVSRLDCDKRVAHQQPLHEPGGDGDGTWRPQNFLDRHDHHGRSRHRFFWLV